MPLQRKHYKDEDGDLNPMNIIYGSSQSDLKSKIPVQTKTQKE